VAPRWAARAACLTIALASGCDDPSDPTPVANSGAAAAGRAAEAAGTAEAPSRFGSRSRVEDNPAGWPPIEFEPAEMHLGILLPGQMGQGTGRIHNVGTEPLQIRASRTTCGCTSTTRLEGKTIQPGGSLPFAVSLEPKSGLGEKREGLRLIFADHQALVTYVFRAEVSLPVRAEPPHLTAVDDRTKQLILTGEFELTARDDRPFRVLAVHGGPPDLVGFDPGRDEPRSSYTVRWDITDMNASGTVPWFLVVQTDHPAAPLVDLRIRHPSTKPPRPAGRPWVPKDQRVVIGPVQAGDPVEVRAKLEYQPREVPAPGTAAVRSESEQFDIQLLAAEADGQVVTVTAVVTPAAGTPGLIYGTAFVEVSGFEMPLRVIGLLEP
jgi:hypothetical protein